MFITIANPFVSPLLKPLSSPSLPIPFHSLQTMLSLPRIPPPTITPLSKSISSLKVPWRKDPALDSAIERDKQYNLCDRVLRSVLLSPGHRLPLRYLEKRRARLRLPVRASTFLARHPNLLDLYPDRLRPSSPPVPFLRPSPRLLSFLSLRSSLQSRLLPLALSKLLRLLMLSRHRSLPLPSLLAAKRVFALPDDFPLSLVPRHPDLLRIVGDNLELVSWPAEHAKSAVEMRADEEARITGVRPRPNIPVRMPKGLYLRKEMREWARDWAELPYVSPYADWSGMRPGSAEMEKRGVGVLHEMLSLAVARRMAVPVVGKFAEDYGLSNEFGNAFTRHPGIFYVSLKGGVRTAMLREAYGEDGEIVDRDPFLEVRDRFVEMVEEGRREWAETARVRREAVRRDLELVARENSEMVVGECDACSGEIIKGILSFI